MTIKGSLLTLLACPINKMQLKPIDTLTLERVNEKIKEGKVVSIDGQLVEARLDDALIRADHRLIYPIERGIPVMLPHKAIKVSKV